jgi:hypothetical protein
MNNDAYARFYQDFLYYKKFLSEIFPRDSLATTGEKIIHIVISPWMGTAVPWYSITIGLLLSKKNYNVKFILDDLPFGQSVSFFAFQKRLIGMILYRVNLHFGIKWSALSDYASNEIPINRDLVNKIAQLNSIHFTKGELNAEKRSAYEEKIKPQLVEAQKLYKAYIDIESPKKFLLPGGIWGNSGILMQLCRENIIEAATYDSGDELVLFSHNGVASQLKDIPSVFHKVWSNEEERNFARDSGKNFLTNRMNGLDGGFSFFNEKSLTINDDEFYLMLLNSVWDSAALGLHTVYTSYFEWVISSINWVLDNTTSKIVIRKHPAERVPSLDNTDNYLYRIEELYKNTSKVIFIDSLQDISSYQLIKRAKCVLGFSSTAIVEAVALGVPSIITSSAYYADLGVAYTADSEAQYHHYLREAANKRLHVSAEMQAKACVINHITQRCNWVKTKFTPQPQNFQVWVRYKSIEPLESDLVMQALVENTPTSYLKHKMYFTARTN